MLRRLRRQSAAPPTRQEIDARWPEGEPRRRTESGLATFTQPNWCGSM
jgi:hypothetical protein